MDLEYTLTGFGVGLLIGLTGVGGGSVMTPTLIYGFGIAPTIAVGTDLLFSAATKTGATWTHTRHGTVQWPIVGWLAAGSLPAAGAVLYILSSWSNSLDSPSSALDLNHLITTTLGFALILTAVVLLLKQRLLAWIQLSPRSTSAQRTRTITWITGAMIGALVALTSVGAGALGVVALLLLYPHLRTRELVGTDIAHATLLSALAGLGHLHLGSVNFELLGALLLGSLPGTYVGTRLCTRLAEQITQSVLACVLFMVGMRFVL